MTRHEFLKQFNSQVDTANDVLSRHATCLDEYCQARTKAHKLLHYIRECGEKYEEILVILSHTKSQDDASYYGRDKITFQSGHGKVPKDGEIPF